MSLKPFGGVSRGVGSPTKWGRRRAGRTPPFIETPGSCPSRGHRSEFDAARAALEGHTPPVGAVRLPSPDQRPRHGPAGGTGGWGPEDRSPAGRWGNVCRGERRALTRCGFPYEDGARRSGQRTSAKGGTEECDAPNEIPWREVSMRGGGKTPRDGFRSTRSAEGEASCAVGVMDPGDVSDVRRVRWPPSLFRLTERGSRLAESAFRLDEGRCRLNKVPWRLGEVGQRSHREIRRE